MSILKKITKWYNNYPYEGIELTERTYKYAVFDKDYNLKKKEMWIIDELKNKELKTEAMLLNLGTIYIHYHFFELEEKPKDRDTERKMLFWKLKNKVPHVKQEDIIFNYYMYDEKSYLLFTLDKDVLAGLDFYIPEKEYIINSQIMGVYNYYSYLFNKKIENYENVILINMGETITDIIFIEKNKLKNLRSFEIGMLDYLKKTEEESENIIDAFNKFIADIYIPKDIEELLDERKLNNFNKIKDINQNWMLEIEGSIKYILGEADRKKYRVIFTGYEIYFKNLNFVLHNYIGLEVKNINCERKEIPYLSLLGNMVNMHER